MKIKITSIIVVFALIFNMMPLNVFAFKDTLESNPILEAGGHRIYNKILRTFKKKCGEDEFTPMNFKVKVRRSADKRETQVSNMPYITEGSSILSISRRIFIGLNSCEVEAKEIAEQKGTKFEDEFKIIARNYLSKSPDIEEFAENIGLPRELVIESYFYDFVKNPNRYVSEMESRESFIRALPMLGIAALSKVLCLIPHSGKGLSIVTSLIALPLTIAGAFFYGKGVKALKVKLENERQMGIKELFNHLKYFALNCKEEKWRKQNVFMTSIDKRDCSPFLFWNAWNNYCNSWAGFSSLKNLKGAPTVQEGDELDKKISEILHENIN